MRDGNVRVMTAVFTVVGLGGSSAGARAAVVPHVVLRRTPDGWSAPRHLAAPVDSDKYEYGPSVSADGEWLYFTSHRSGSGDIYRVRLRDAGLPPGH